MFQCRLLFFTNQTCFNFDLMKQIDSYIDYESKEFVSTLWVNISEFCKMVIHLLSFLCLSLVKLRLVLTFHVLLTRTKTHIDQLSINTNAKPLSQITYYEFSSNQSDRLTQ